MAYEKFTIREKIGQRFIFGINRDNADDIIDLIKKRHIGGVVLYKKNYRSYDEMIKLIKRLKEANKENKIPLFIAIDQEGGIVNRMPNEVSNLINIYSTTEKDSNLVNEYADIIGEMLESSGINMNFGPVMDIYNNSKSKVVYKRCFYGDKADVIRGGKTYIKELDKHHIVSVIKHFPGHGSTKIDSHFVAPYIYNYKEIIDKHIKPFESTYEEAPAIMLGHLVIRKLTNLLPVSMANDFINKYLRSKYEGLIISDEINMLKRDLIYRYNYLKRMFLSENDMLLVKIKDVNEGYKILDEYEKMADVSKLDEHIKRILKVKKDYNINDDISFKGMDITLMNKKIDKFNEGILGGMKDEEEY